MFNLILAIATSIAVLVADQLSKAYVAANCVATDSHIFIPGILEFALVHNGGGAWGMLSGHTWLLLAVTSVIMVVCVFMLVKLGKDNKLIQWAVCLVLGGGIGNMIDRIFRGGYVIDFFRFSFWRDFPVFNIADISIVVGAGLLMLYFVLSSFEDIKNKKDTALVTVENDAKNQ